jgi:myo-inositol 2-dehydrogenase / D-chiro-inositol 1-dehydrogenase
VTLGVGIVGVGLIGQDHARRLSGVVAGARVAAVADADAGRARQVAQDLPGARALDTGHDVIAASDVDAVLVTSSGTTHEEFVLAAIAAGKPVFCEKPLAPTPDACLRIIAAEQAAGRRLVQVGFMRRYDPGYRALRQAVDGGAIGAPLLAHCVHRNAASPPGFTSDMLLTDSGVHEMDIMRWLLGQEITAVSVIQPRRTSRVPGGLQDPQLLLMETASGVHIDVELFVNCGFGYDIRCELVGETGTASLTNPAAVSLRTAGTIAEPVYADWRQRFAGAYDTELRDWVASAAAGLTNGPSAWDGYAAAAIAEAALRARASGQRVPVVLADRPACYGPANARTIIAR